MKHTHNIEKFQLWVAVAEIAVAVLLVVLIFVLGYTIWISQ